MRTFLLTALVAAAAILPIHAIEQDLMPGERETVELRAGERNPFGQLALPVIEQTDSGATETEEFRLRKILGSIKVGGVVSSGTNRTLLLGSLILREGDRLPSIIAGQSEVLTVSKISPNEALISFTEIDKATEARTITIPLDIKPRVASLLYGEAVKSLIPSGKDGRLSLDKIKLDSVADLLKGAKDSDLQGIANREFEMMGEQNAPAKPTGTQ